MTTIGSSILSDLKELKKLVHERCRSWFSELSIMEDDVRDRTILVRVHSERDPISDLTIYEVFSDFGLVEKFRYMCAESGFHYLLQFGSAYSANQALHYYNGRSNFHGYCRFDVSFVNEVISSHVQKVFDGFRKTIHKESPKNDEDVRQTTESIQEGESESLKALNQGEEAVQIETNNEHVVAKGSIDLTAYQVFDEMPMPFDKGIGLVDAFPKEFEVSLGVTIDQEAPPLTSNEEKDGSKSKIFGVCKTETELLVELEMENALVTALCFDPGGRALKQVGNSLNFEDGAREDDELRCCDEQLKDMRFLFGTSYVDITTQEHAICDASKVEDITKLELDVHLLVFDPGGDFLKLAGLPQMCIAFTCNFLSTVAYGCAKKLVGACLTGKIKFVMEILDFEKVHPVFDPGGEVMLRKGDYLVVYADFEHVNNDVSCHRGAGLLFVGIALMRCWFLLVTVGLLENPQGVASFQAYVLGVDTHLAGASLLRTESLTDATMSGDILIFDPRGEWLILAAMVHKWSTSLTDSVSSCSSLSARVILVCACFHIVIFDPGGDWLESHLVDTYVIYVMDYYKCVSMIMPLLNSFTSLALLRLEVLVSYELFAAEDARCYSLLTTPLDNMEYGDRFTFGDFEAQISKDEQVGDVRSSSVDAELLFVAADVVFHLPRIIFVFDPGTNHSKLVDDVQHSSHQVGGVLQCS